MPKDDGRNIDPLIGGLLGEGAQQISASGRTGSKAASRRPVWEQRPEGGEPSPTYYERPVLKEPVWIWAVPAYFFCGGAAGAAAVLGTAAQLIEGRKLRALSNRCRWIAAAGTGAGGVLLVYDLGRPERFLNMLRVFRPSSAMSMGSWVLAASGSLSAAAAVLARRSGLAGKAGDAAAVGSGVFGLPLAGYTAVLLSDTAVPIWQQTRHGMPALFAASAASAASCLLRLGRLDEPSRRVARTFGLAGAAAELAAAEIVQRQAGSPERVGRPLKEGAAGALWKAAKALTGLSLALALPGRKPSRLESASAACGAMGSLSLRFAVFYAGKQSARDPRATFETQRRRLDQAPPRG